MTLYQHIIFLKHHFKGLWVVENVKPYYAPLLKPTATLQRHLFWSNFPIKDKQFPVSGIRKNNKLSDFGEIGVKLKTYSGLKEKRRLLRNMVNSDLGGYVLQCALEYMRKEKVN